MTWSSSAVGVATVSPAGLVTAVAPGTASITASSEGQQGTATLTVTPVPVATIAFPSDSIDVPLRASRQLDVTLKDASGAPLSGRTVSWQVTPSTTASVTSAGLVRMLLPGTVTVTATSEGKSASVRIRGAVANLATIVDSLRGAFGLPALGGAIVAREGLIGIGVAGSRRITGGLPVTVDDQWHIGSNTKALTGVLAAMAVDAGVISWSTTLAAAFPELASVMRAEYRDVTLRELLSHTGGLVNSTAGLTGTADLRAARLAWTSNTVQQPPQNARGVYYYSNNGFGIAGAMIERAWGGTYEQLMAQRLFTPLGLVNVGWGPTTTVGGMNQPVGHRRTAGAWVVCEACDNFGGLSSAGTMHLPLGSWARIIQELLQADQGRSSLLPQQSARFLTTNQVPAADPFDYGIGWGIGASPTNRFVGHDGSNTTNHSRASLFLDAGVGFLLVTNAAEIPGISNDALNAAQLRLDRYWQTGR